MFHMQHNEESSWLCLPSCYSGLSPGGKIKLIRSSSISLHSPFRFVAVVRLNSLTPKSDQRLISPYNITPESHIKVMRIKEMITNQRSSWLLNKFSLSAPLELYRDHLLIFLWRTVTLLDRCNFCGKNIVTPRCAKLKVKIARVCQPRPTDLLSDWRNTLIS